MEDGCDEVLNTFGEGAFYIDLVEGIVSIQPFFLDTCAHSVFAMHAFE